MSGSVKIFNFVSRKELCELQDNANNAARLVTEAITRGWPVGTCVQVKLRADQKISTDGEVMAHWGCFLVVKLTSTKKQKVKHVHWRKIVFP
jgi:hypothetical protein